MFRALLLALVLAGAAQAQSELGEAPQLRIAGAGHHAAIRALASDARGERILTVSEDKTARLWRTRDQKLQAVLRPPIGPGNEGKLYAGALTPDGQIAAVAGWSADNDVYLFRTADAQLLARIQGLPNVVNQLAFSPDGKQLAVLLWGRHGLQIWQAGPKGWGAPAFGGADTDYADSGYGLAFSPDGQRLAASAHDGRVRLYALRGGAPWRQAQRALGGRPQGLQFSPDGRWLAAGSADQGLLQVLGADDLEPRMTLRADAPAGQPAGLSSPAWSADGAELFAAGSWRLGPGRHGLLRFALDGRRIGEALVLGSDSISQLLRLPDGRLAFAAADASWGVLDAQHRPQAQRAARTDFRSLDERVQLRVSSDGRRVAWPGWPAAFDVNAFAWRAEVEAQATHAGRTGAELSDWRDGRAPRLNGRAIEMQSGEQIGAAAVDPQRPRLALGSNGRLRWLDLKGALLWQQELGAPCFALAIPADGRHVIAGLADGTLRWYASGDGEERLAFYNEGRAWVAWTPEGRFAAGEGGEALVGWHLNRGSDRAAEFLPLARFFERYTDPQAVFSALAPPQGALPPPRQLADPRQGLRLPPLVRLLGPAAGSLLREAALTLKVQAEDRGGGIDELRLYLNDKLVEAPTQQKRAARSLEGQWQLRLEPGENRLRALALSQDRTESPPAELLLQLEAAPRRPTLHALIVGVNQYRNGALNLSFSVPDARGISGLLKRAAAKLFDQVQVHELLDAGATKSAIVEQLQGLRQSREDDVVLVYLAGHGETQGNDWFFIPHDLTQPEQPERLQQGGLSSRELVESLRRIPARKVVVLIDACKSGAAAAGFAAGTRGLEERRVLAQLSRATGTHLIAATTKEQLASELHQLGHGVFTYALLEGLGGKAAAGGPEVTARKLMVYVEQALPELSKRFRAEEQFPVVNSTGMDFPLVLK